MAKSDTSRPSAFARSDLWVGAVLVAVGLYACWEASGFDASSRGYPMILAGLLAIAGLAVILIGPLSAGKAVSLAGPLRAALPAAVVVSLWAAALGTGGGFILPTLLMQVALLWLGGVRGALRIAVFAVLITAAAYTLFALVLDVRLPAPGISWLV